MNQEVNAQDFQMMKKVDHQYGEQVKVPKTAPKKQKEKHRVDFSRMSINEIFDMENDE